MMRPGLEFCVQMKDGKQSFFFFHLRQVGLDPTDAILRESTCLFKTYRSRYRDTDTHKRFDRDVQTFGTMTSEKDHIDTLYI